MCLRVFSVIKTHSCANSNESIMNTIMANDIK